MSRVSQGWSRRAVLSGMVGWAACARSAGRAVDVSLPDGEPVDVGTPLEVLQALAADREPMVRGRALAGLVRSLPESAVVRWSTQGTYDPDPWVQARVLEALVDRGDDFGRTQVQQAWARRSTEAHAIGAAMHRLMDAGHDPDPDTLSAVWPEARPWDGAPRALVAWRAGVTEAALVVQAALGSGLMREEPGTLARLGAHGDPAWEADARRGAERVEEMAPSLTFVRGVWGNRDAARAWTRDVRDPDPFVARTALDLAVALPDSLRPDWTIAGRAAKDEATRRAALAWSRPSRATVQRALAEPEAYAGEVSIRAVGLLAEADRRAVLAVALTHAQEEVVLAAVVQVQRLGVRGLADLLVPLSTHPSAALRATVAGALHTTAGA